MNLILYSPFCSNRFNYICSFMLSHLIETKFVITNEIADYQSFKGVKINYSNDSIAVDEVWIQPHTLLFEKNIKEQQIELVDIDNIPCFFATGLMNNAFDFDLFSCAFYMLSRYEEYLNFEADTHQRFNAKQSLAFHAGFLEFPIIHQWLELLVKAIWKNHPDFKPKVSIYTFYPTYDIDIPWAFRHRGLRGWARASLDVLQGRWSFLKARLKSLKRPDTDPFFTFNHLKAKHQYYGIRPLAFWLIADNSRYDINPRYGIKAFQNLIQKTSEWSDTGLHPSYRSNEQNELLNVEKQRLETVLHQSIIKSRQHFLRLHLPQTYRQLIAVGIEEDYSMGYADKIGYRAGTSESFYWYDLKNDKSTQLLIHPFVAMDVTLKQYENYSPEQAKEKLMALQEYCKEKGLSFRTLWHNSSFSDLHGWKDWSAVYWTLFD